MNICNAQEVENIITIKNGSDVILVVLRSFIRADQYCLDASLLYGPEILIDVFQSRYGEPKRDSPHVKVLTSKMTSCFACWSDICLLHKIESSKGIFYRHLFFDRKIFREYLFKMRLSIVLKNISS